MKLLNFVDNTKFHLVTAAGCTLCVFLLAWTNPIAACWAAHAALLWFGNYLREKRVRLLAQLNADILAMRTQNHDPVSYFSVFKGKCVVTTGPNLSVQLTEDGVYSICKIGD